MAWIVAGAPLRTIDRLASSNLGVTNLFLGFLASMILIGGWVAYSGYYPLWQVILLKIHFIPELKAHTKVLEAIRAQKVTGVSAKSAWSFILWNDCNEAVRTRVKTLANYAHSSFMAAGGLIVYPVLYALLRAATGYTSVLSRLSFLLSSEFQLSSSYLESIFLAGSIVSGIIIVIEGRTRWIESDSIQYMLFNQKKERLIEVVKGLADAKS